MQRIIQIVIALAVAGGMMIAQPTYAEQSRCFAETNQCVGGRFLEFWQQNGGLAVFGLPIGPARQEQMPEGRFLVQYFERQRFELHPENRAPYDVLLGRLGADQLEDMRIDWQSLPRGKSSSAHYFAETGHAIARQFWGYWSSHGLQIDGGGVSYAESLALFGLPISELLLGTNLSGDTVLVQYFERARLEFHPANQPAYQVLQGRLGSELLPGGNVATSAGQLRIYRLIQDQGSNPWCLFAVNSYLSGGSLDQLAAEYYRGGLPTWDGKTPYNENVLSLTQSLYGARWHIWSEGDWSAARAGVVEGHPTAFTGGGHAIVVLSFQAGYALYVDSLHPQSVQIMSEQELRSWWDGWAWYNELDSQRR